MEPEAKPQKPTICMECRWHDTDDFGVGIVHNCLCPRFGLVDLISGKTPPTSCSCNNRGACEGFEPRPKGWLRRLLSLDRRTA